MPILKLKDLENKGNKAIYFEDKRGFGIYCKNGLPVNKIIKAINKKQVSL